MTKWDVPTQDPAPSPLEWRPGQGTASSLLYLVPVSPGVPSPLGPGGTLGGGGLVGLLRLNS